MLLKRYGDYITLLGLVGFAAAAYLAYAQGFSLLLLLIIFYAILITATGIAMRLFGNNSV